MLRIYSVILETIRTLQPMMEKIERKDPDLGRQMRRAASSIALSVSEGCYSRGGNRQVREAEREREPEGEREGEPERA